MPPSVASKLQAYPPRCGGSDHIGADVFNLPRLGNSGELADNLLVNSYNCAQIIRIASLKLTRLMHTNKTLKLLLLAFSLPIALNLSGCQPRERVASPTEKRYDLKGK